MVDSGKGNRTPVEGPRGIQIITTNRRRSQANFLPRVDVGLPYRDPAVIVQPREDEFASVRRPWARSQRSVRLRVAFQKRKVRISEETRLTTERRHQIDELRTPLIAQKG